MTEQKLTELLRHAYQWGRDNGSSRSEKNFNDFLQTEAVQQALSIPDVVWQSEQLVCPNCDGEGFSGKGTNEILPCLSCFGSGEMAD